MKEVELHTKLKRLAELKANFGLFFYSPYQRQIDFHNAGKTKRERLLMAGNKLGKTYAASNEVAFHLTGMYPPWWDGHRFLSAPRGWVGSFTAEIARDGAQRLLLGPPGRWGTGAIPKNQIAEIKRAKGVPDAVESILVRHITGEIAQVTFKSYKDGREAWQAEDLEFVWFDEEPKFDIYMEGITRTNNSGGPIFLTFTPLLGISEVVRRFWEETHEDRIVVNMTIDDVNHYSVEQKRKIIESYPAHEREARVNGQPMLGSGRVFPVAFSEISEPPLREIPDYWEQIVGLDFGWEHPTAAVRLAWDKEKDVVHVINAYKKTEATPIIHAAVIRHWGQWLPVAWPHDGYQHDKGSGEQIAELYRKQDLHMLPTRAEYPDERGYHVEDGIMDMLQRMQTGRLKIDETLTNWRDEFLTYHRKDGKITKQNDDLLCATRYGLMMLRYAQSKETEVYFSDRYGRHVHGDNTTWMTA